MNANLEERFGFEQEPIKQIPLSNATATLILGIVSIVTCCCYGIVGIICAVIALVFAKKDTDKYKQNPELYTSNSYKNVKAGQICAIIGLVFSTLFFIYLIWIISVVGIDGLNDPDLTEKIEDLKNRRVF